MNIPAPPCACIQSVERNADEHLRVWMYARVSVCICVHDDDGVHTRGDSFAIVDGRRCAILICCIFIHACVCVYMGVCVSACICICDDIVDCGSVTCTDTSSSATLFWHCRSHSTT